MVNYDAPDELPARFPKIQSPFVREENESGDYVTTGEVADGYEWVLEDDDVIAVEKLDGSNGAVYIHPNYGVTQIYTRMGQDAMQPVNPYGSGHHSYMTRAVQNSKSRNYLKGLDSGIYFGEFVGPKFQGNPHELDEQLFIPFNWARDKLAYKSWGKYERSHDAVENWFSDGLSSLFYSRMHGVDLEESSVSNGTFCEGIMFTKPGVGGPYEPGEVPDTNKMAKVRRDMFADWGQWPGTGSGHGHSGATTEDGSSQGVVQRLLERLNLA